MWRSPSQTSPGDCTPGKWNACDNVVPGKANLFVHCLPLLVHALDLRWKADLCKSVYNPGVFVLYISPRLHDPSHQQRRPSTCSHDKGSCFSRQTFLVDNKITPGLDTEEQPKRQSMYLVQPLRPTCSLSGVFLTHHYIKLHCNY